MNIKFCNVVPNPLIGFLNDQSLFNTEFEFKAGNFYQLIAPSGKGKSTVIGLISGIRGDYTGDVLFGNQLAADYKPQDWSRWRSQICSTVYQDLQLFPHLTVMENIMVNKEVQAIENASDFTRNSTEAPNERVKLWAEKLGVIEKLYQTVSTLSFGQMQRIAIIRALNRDYQWIILDEPFSHLDQANTQMAIDLILEESAAKDAGIIITALDHRDSDSRFQKISV